MASSNFRAANSLLPWSFSSMSVRFWFPCLVDIPAVLSRFLEKILVFRELRTKVQSLFVFHDALLSLIILSCSGSKQSPTTALRPSFRIYRNLLEGFKFFYKHKQANIVTETTLPRYVKYFFGWRYFRAGINVFSSKMIDYYYYYYYDLIY